MHGTFFNLSKIPRHYIMPCRLQKMSNVAKSREPANYELSLPWVPLDASSHFEKSGTILLKQLIYEAYSFRI